MKAEIHPLRVLLKALFLFAAVHVIFALVNPSVGKLTLYNSIVPGRLGFAVAQFLAPEIQKLGSS